MLSTTQHPEVCRHLAAISAWKNTLTLLKVYHNQDCRFMAYQDGQLLVAVSSHWLPSGAGHDPRVVADWAYHIFNADLDTLEAGRGRTADGETTFLAGCVYRLMGHRSLSIGDVVEVQAGPDHHWLACEPTGWRPIPPPSNLSGQPLSAATVYQRLAHSGAASEPHGGGKPRQRLVNARPADPATAARPLGR